MDYQRDSIGQIVKETRKTKGIKTQRQLAYRVKVDPVYICNLEKDRLIPSIEIGTKIASVLNLDMREFIYLILRTKHPQLSHLFQ